MSWIPTRVAACAALASCVLAGLPGGPIRADDKESSGPVLKGWGRVVDPEGDCKITSPDARTLAFSLPGTSHDYSSDIKVQNAPRVLREIKGDFILTVKVTGEFKPAPPSTQAGRVPYHGAGVFLIKDKDNYVSLHRGSVFLDAGVRHYANFELRKDGEMAISKYEIEIPDEDVYLRLERRGGKIFEGSSPDGVHWTAYDPIELEMPETIQVGFMGLNTSALPVSFQFRDLAIHRKVEAD